MIIFEWHTGQVGGFGAPVRLLWLRQTSPRARAIPDLSKATPEQPLVHRTLAGKF